MKELLLLLMGFILGVFATLVYFDSSIPPEELTQVEVIKQMQFDNLTQSLGRVVLAHPRAKGATWEEREEGTFFVNVDIGNKETMELVFRMDVNEQEGMVTTNIVRARILKGSKVIPCEYPGSVLKAMDDGTSFSDAGCGKSNPFF